MIYFDHNVQQLKYEVLSEVARLAFKDQLDAAHVIGVADTVVKPEGERIRCCVYKERAIANERVKLALGGGESDGTVEVIDIACDECPVDGILVTGACRGCLAHRCIASCPKDAIRIVDRRATIDKAKCVECGRCVAACSYKAIIKQVRPCVDSCKANAITIDEKTDKALIRQDKCVSCGACVYRCPFGAIVDKSQVTDVIGLLNNSEGNEKYKVYAMVAPSFASQYANIPQITTEKIVTAIKQLGFHSVIEAALGADMVAYMEAQELVEKGFLTSSCCPSFVAYVNKSFPSLAQHVSHNLSPMAQLGKVIKQSDPTCKVVFIGPCISKKAEAKLDSVAPYIDHVITFEEMQALFSAKDIELEGLEETELDNASYFGRIFARTGGLAEAVGQALKEQNVGPDSFVCKPVVCSGMAECRAALTKAAHGKLDENFIEGMFCEGGCIGGPASLAHSNRDKLFVDNYGKKAMERTIGDSISVFGDLNKPACAAAESK